MSLRRVRSLAVALAFLAVVSFSFEAIAFIECNRQCRSGHNSCEMKSGKSCRITATGCVNGGPCPGHWEDCDEFASHCELFQW